MPSTYIDHVMTLNSTNNPNLLRLNLIYRANTWEISFWDARPGPLSKLTVTEIHSNCMWDQSFKGLVRWFQAIGVL